MDQFWQDVVAFSRATSEQVGAKLEEYFGQVQADHKDDGSLVTHADKWADGEIRQAITDRFPDHGVLTEETQHILPDNDWCWVIDPVDGTTNFTRGLPLWGISMGLLYRGTPVFGYAYYPPIRKAYHGFWYGDTGLTGPTGAYLNDKPIQTTPDSPTYSHLFNICARSTAVIKNKIPCKIRMVGVASYSCMLVASGAAIGGVEATPKIWDIAAAWAIVHAAGGTFTLLNTDTTFPLQPGEDYQCRPFPCLITSQANVVPTFFSLVEFLGEKVREKS